MKERFTILMLVALAIGVLAPTLHAGMVLKLDDGVGHSFTVSDNGSDDQDSTVGVITFASFASGPIGIWNLNVTTGTSKPFYAALPPSMDLNSVNANSSGAGTLEILLTDTDFATPPGPSALLVSEWGGTTTGTVTLEQIFDPSNTEFGTSAYTLTSGPFGPGAFSETLSLGVPADLSFSITEHVYITHRSTGTTSFDAASTVVPVPGAILLGFLGLGAAGLKLRRFA